MKFRPPARAVILAGFMGTGKSVVGQQLSQRLGLKLVELDELIEQATGRSIPDIFAEEGEGAFRDYESQALGQAAAQTSVVISTGGGVLIREDNLKTLRKAGPIFCLQASADTLYQRTRRSDYRPLLQGDDPRAALEQLLQERQPVYARADYAVPTEGLGIEQVADQIIELMRQDSRAVFLLDEPVRVPVAVSGAEYEIHLGSGLLSRLGELVPALRPGLGAAVITSENLRKPYAEPAVSALAAAGWEASLHVVPDGEQSKRMAVAEALCGELAAAGHDRGSWVFAVGGGVIGDLAGFVAAIYMRGIKFVTVPTSLLAQVDASVGGKVAVNLPQGKNLIGAFHQPQAVVIDTDSLQTLPSREWGEGLAEIIKHAAIADRELFEFLEREMELVRSGDRQVLQYVVARNCQIKAEVVAQDPEEQGWRAVLNFGHTVGHALERGAEKWAWGHGEAVALGMLAETRWAEAQGLTPAGISEHLCRLLQAAGLPRAAERMDWDRANQALSADKKLRRGRLALPVLGEIGSVRLEEGVGLAQLQAALARAREG